MRARVYLFISWYSCSTRQVSFVQLPPLLARFPVESAFSCQFSSCRNVYNSQFTLSVSSLFTMSQLSIFQYPLWRSVRDAVAILSIHLEYFQVSSRSTLNSCIHTGLYLLHRPHWAIPPLSFLIYPTLYKCGYVIWFYWNL